MTDQPEPTIIDGRYRVLRRLGSGGMADVFCAEDLQLGRNVAVKVLHRRFAEDASFVERFRREASSAAGLSHPNVVGIYDRGAWDGTFYIAMEYIEGRTLKQVVQQEGPLPPARAAAFVEQVLQAVRAAHSRSIVHRDLKPQNVIVGDDGRVKVTDFGIAKAGSSDMTETGSILGTAQYLSPEQAEGRPLGAPSDLYSVGVILYELLCGRVPFDGDSAVTIALKHMQEAPIPPSRLQPAVGPALEAVVLHALEKSPESRFQSADEFLAALHGATTAPPSAAAEPPSEPSGSARRWWLGLGIGLLALAALAVGVLVTGQDKVAVPSVVGDPQAEAQLKLRRAGFATDAQTKPSLDVAAGEVIGQDPTGGSKAAKGSTVTITVSSGPGEVTMPDLTGEARLAARKRLEKLDLEIVEERATSEEVGENRVIETRPGAGQKIDRGSQVTLVISSGRPRVVVPKVTGLSLDQARTALESAGFTVTITRKEDEQAEPNTVLEQSPAADARAPKGSAVAVTVARQPAEISVPDVVGRGQQTATQTLDRAGFAVVTTDRPVDDPAQDGRVIEQQPTGKARRESTVTIVIGRLQQETTTIAPEGEGDGG